MMAAPGTGHWRICCYFTSEAPLLLANVQEAGVEALPPRAWLGDACINCI